VLPPRVPATRVLRASGVGVIGVLGLGLGLGAAAATSVDSGVAATDGAGGAAGTAATGAGVSLAAVAAVAAAAVVATVGCAACTEAARLRSTVMKVSIKAITPIIMLVTTM